ncbi:four helix bundle protein [Collimonas fungivorans]|uniref:bAvd-like domain-containing protein n=1 Tax=Collimonas fungivorans (strain Ter331) TaxID=1005048 RepID=G0AAI6_COLFT|nr:four helix bundle protein [Collimonas fungivorans]AEK63200.1 hypothetical protein CFU_3376 [Collimonas fungivorans Ter331]
MAIHHQLPIYKAAYGLLKLMTTITKNMPKDFKASIGGEIRSLCVQSVILIARANAAQDKAPHLTTLLEHIHAAEILLRLSQDMRFISTGQYATAISLTDVIGKQANGWRKSAIVPAPVTSPPRQSCQSEIF